MILLILKSNFNALCLGSIFGENKNLQIKLLSLSEY